MPPKIRSERSKAAPVILLAFLLPLVTATQSALASRESDLTVRFSLFDAETGLPIPIDRKEVEAADKAPS